MKHKNNIIIFVLLLLSMSASAQIQFTAGLNYESGVPSGAPSSTGSRIRVNLATGRAYIWNQAGTSPAASATVAVITLAQSFPNETCPIPAAGNANAAGQMTNFYTEATTTTITLKVTSALAASTQYIVRFNLFGR